MERRRRGTTSTSAISPGGPQGPRRRGFLRYPALSPCRSERQRQKSRTGLRFNWSNSAVAPAHIEPSRADTRGHFAGVWSGRRGDPWHRGRTSAGRRVPRGRIAALGPNAVGQLCFRERCTHLALEQPECLLGDVPDMGRMLLCLRQAILEALV